MEFQLLYDNVCTAAPSKENNRENCVDENPNEGMKYEDEDDEKCVFKCYCTMCFSFQAAVVVEMGWILSLPFFQLNLVHTAQKRKRTRIADVTLFPPSLLHFYWTRIILDACPAAAVSFSVCREEAEEEENGLTKVTFGVEHKHKHTHIFALTSALCVWFGCECKPNEMIEQWRRRRRRRNCSTSLDSYSRHLSFPSLSILLLL